MNSKPKYRLPTSIFETLVFGAESMLGIGHPPLNTAPGCDASDIQNAHCDWHGEGCWTLNPLFYGDGEKADKLAQTEFSLALVKAGLTIHVLAQATFRILDRAYNGYGPFTRVSFEELSRELGGIEPYDDGTEGYGTADASWD